LAFEVTTIMNGRQIAAPTYKMKDKKLMKREFISTKIFDKRWSEIGLTDDDLCRLENYIMDNPHVGEVIEGTGGAIKLRFALPGAGKSGGVRTIYVDLIKFKKIHLITCYPKSKKDTLTDKEKAAIKDVVKHIIKNEREGL
jgi:hypothetical protein